MARRACSAWLAAFGGMAGKNQPFLPKKDETGRQTQSYQGEAEKTRQTSSPSAIAAVLERTHLKRRPGGKKVDCISVLLPRRNKCLRLQYLSALLDHIKPVHAQVLQIIHRSRRPVNLEHIHLLRFTEPEMKS